MEKKASLAIIVLCIIEAICCFTPYCLKAKYFQYEQSFVYHGKSSLKRVDSINIFGIKAALGKQLAWLFIVIIIAVTIVFLINIIHTTKKLSILAVILAVVHTIVMTGFLYYSCYIAEVERISDKYRYAINWMSYVIIAINAITLILAILSRIGAMKVSSTREQNVQIQQKESVEDLLAYKELLDSGIISQEEFNNKKKQILGI